MVWAFLSESREEIIAEIEDQTDRAAALVAFAFLEDRLTETLIAKMKNRDSEIVSRMFKGIGPLGTFAAKNDLAFSLGLYPKSVHRELITIKDIRNKFAHAAERVTFESQAIKALCMNLSLPPTYQKSQISVAALKRLFDDDFDAWLRVLFAALLEDADTVRGRYIAKIRLFYLLFGAINEDVRRAGQGISLPWPDKSERPRPPAPQRPSRHRKKP